MQVMKRTYSREFKLNLCRRVENQETTGNAVCREFGLSSGTWQRWIDQYRAKGEEAFQGQPWRSKEGEVDDTEDGLRARIKQLEASLGRAHLEVEFMREALGKLGGPRGSGPR